MCCLHDLMEMGLKLVAWVWDAFKNANPFLGLQIYIGVCNM